MCSWNFVFGQHITMAMFYFVLSWKKGKNTISPKASRWKSESTSENPSWFWKKTTLKHMFGNYCITGILFTCETLHMGKGQLKKILQQETRKIKKPRLLSRRNFKVQFVWRFYFSSEHNAHLEHTQSASRHCFPTLHPSWTCYWARH